jgi:hypothetical protein
MSFVFPMLLGGLALVSVPVLLHLIMRQKPKHLLFPAFRFLLQRHKTNLRKLRLRHLLLLALRVLLIAAVCFALARPRARSDRLPISPEQPVAAVLLFDTSGRMGYVVEDQPGQPTLLDLAKRKARDLLDELPSDSRVAVLDGVPPRKMDQRRKRWEAPADARQRVERLRVRPDSSPVIQRLADAYTMLDKLAQDRDEFQRTLPRFLYVFSDRTRPSWDAPEPVLKARQDQADRIPPPLDRLQQLPDRTGPLTETLGALAGRLQVSGGPVLVEQLQQLKEYIPSAGAADYPDATVTTLVPKVRAQARELVRLLRRFRKDLPAETAEFRDKALGQLNDLLRDLKGAYEVYVDVGVDNPMNLGVVSLQLSGRADGNKPRQVFATREKIFVRATVQATGDSYSQRVECLVDGKLQVTPQQVKDLQPGRSAVVTFKIDCKDLNRGLHTIKVRVPQVDTLAYDDARYATFMIREGRKVLTVAEDLTLATAWKKAVDATGEFQGDLATPADVTGKGAKKLLGYKAVCLFEVPAPDPDLWKALKQYVDAGGKLLVIPPKDLKSIEDTRQAYNKDRTAQQLLPGSLNGVIQTKADDGVEWDWDKRSANYSHEILKPFETWRQDPGIDFVKSPRRAERYWDVKADKPSTTVLIRYQDKENHPAILERRLATGRVLLFTTTMDGDVPPQGWNDYMANLTSFRIVLPHLTIRYLVKTLETAGLKLNFQSGDPVVPVPVPPAGRHPPYYVEGPGLVDAPTTLELKPSAAQLLIRGAVRPGNYPVYDHNRQRIACFSVNVPPNDSDLTRVPEERVADLFGPEAVVPAGGDVKLLDALRQRWSQPVELLPLFLVLLLLLLVVENLLANKFYRRDPDAAQEAAHAERLQP